MWKHANGSINVEKALVAGRSNMKRCNVANVALKYREGRMPRSNIIYMKRYIYVYKINQIYQISNMKRCNVALS